MQALARGADVELAERVKVAFARYYAAYLSRDNQDERARRSG
jgi:hypothetical protein